MVLHDRLTVIHDAQKARIRMTLHNSRKDECNRPSLEQNYYLANGISDASCRLMAASSLFSI
jgi:hypothetical protein